LGSRLEGRPITIEVPDVLAPMDFVLMAQVLVNLLDNALKYSPPGTPIGVEAHVAERVLEMAVTDRGAGIPPEDLERIFDKFYRVHRPDSVGGTGLGLAICKAILEAHQGRIHAQNRPGGGTIITLVLLIDEAEQAAGSAAP